MLIEVLETRNCGLEARNAELAAQVADMAERLARLERAVSRNSGNSGMPPSADDLPGKTPPVPGPKRGGGKKKQGKQPALPARTWPGARTRTRRSRCSRRVRVRAAGPGGRDDGVVASHQLVDTPVVTATVTQYDEHAVACRCGRVHAAAPRPGAGEAVTGPTGRPAGLSVFLLVTHHVPVERCAGIIEALTGARPSDCSSTRRSPSPRTPAGRECAVPRPGDHRVRAGRRRDPGCATRRTASIARVAGTNRRRCFVGPMTYLAP